MNERKIIGLVVYVTIYSDNGKSIRIPAKVDTGASISSIDVELASQLELGPLVKAKSIKSSLGHMKRPAVRANIEIEGIKLNTIFTVADRAHLKYKVLIGKNTLKEGKFIIDPLLG